MSEPDVIAMYVDEFFRAPSLPATTHEEWLLRLCAQLMHREATVVSIMEYEQQNRQRQWTRNYSGSQTSTEHS